MRVIPFAVFCVLTYCQGQFGEAGRYWFYFGKTIAGAGMLIVTWKHVAEMRWKLSWEAVVAGVAVLAIWIGLDGLYPSLDELMRKIGLGSNATAKPVTMWNPHTQFGHNSVLAWFFIIVRIAGSTIVVPPLEEVFYRSFLYRYLAKSDFQAVALGQFCLGPILISSVIFGFSHFEWLAGILCAFVYQGLVCWKKRLGDAMTAHAITNFLLGLWVVSKDAWNFW